MQGMYNVLICCILIHIYIYAKKNIFEDTTGTVHLLNEIYLLPYSLAKLI